MACMLLCSHVNAWAGSDDEAFLEKVAKEFVGMKVPLKNIVGVDVAIKQSVTYQDKVFEVRCVMERARYEDALPLSQISPMIKFYCEDNPKQTLVLEVLLLEKHFPGFLDAMIKSKSSYRVQMSLPSTDYQYAGELNSKELKQIERVDTSTLTALSLKKGVDLFNSVLLPFKAPNGNVLNRLIVQDNKLVVDIQISDKALMAMQKNMDLMKKAFYFNPLINSNYPRDLVESVEYGFILTTSTGRRQDISYTSEEREQLAAMPVKNTDRQMYMILINGMSDLPTKTGPYQTRVGFEYADRTLSMIDEVHADNDRVREMMKRQEYIRGAFIEHVFTSEKLYKNFSENGVNVRRVFRGLTDSDISYMMTAKEIDSLLKTPQRAKDSLLIQCKMDVLNLQFSLQQCREGYLCPCQISIEGDHVVWSVVGNIPLEKYKQYVQRDLSAKALEVYRSKANDVLRDAVKKLQKNLIYRFYSPDMKLHHDTLISYDNLKTI